MRILVYVPGNWSEGGFNHPGRGESRWSAHIALMLARAGHTVFGASAGVTGDKPHHNLTLITERDISRHGPYDLYIDSSWWEGKPVPKDSKYYFHVHWSLEPRLWPKMPKNHFIIYPYAASKEKFLDPVNQNSDRTFFLPIPVCDEFADPGITFDSRKDLLLPVRVLSAGNERILIEDYLGRLDTFTKDNNINLHILVGGNEPFDKRRHLVKGKDNIKVYETIPYNDVLNLLKSVRVNASFYSPSSIIDAAAYGIPTLMWESGSFFNEVAAPYDLLIDGDNSDRAVEVLSRVYSDRDLFINYTKDIQNVLKDHTYAAAQAAFEHIEKHL
jgi:hypothetical protein